MGRSASKRDGLTTVAAAWRRAALKNLFIYALLKYPVDLPLEFNERVRERINGLAHALFNDLL